MEYTIDDIVNVNEEEIFKKNKHRAIRRKNNVKKALRKQRIASSVFGSKAYYNNLHQYSKNKIHCSCPMCSGMTKTNSKNINKGGAKPQIKDLGFGTTNHRTRKNWNISDIKKINSCESQIAEI